MELVYKVFFIFLLPWPCLGANWEVAQKLISIAGPLKDELVSNLNFQNTPVRDPPFNSATAESGYLCHWSSLSSLAPYVTQLHANGVTDFKVFLPWAHILPEGNAQKPNETNVECYRELLRIVRAAEIKPVIILHQKHLPEFLHTQLALDNSRTFVDFFVEYAEFAFESFGDFVDKWLTFSDFPEITVGLSQRDPLPLPLQTVASAHRKAYEVYHGKYSSEGKEKGGWDRGRSCMVSFAST